MSDPATGTASYLVAKHIEFRRSIERNSETAAVLQAYLETKNGDQ